VTEQTQTNQVAGGDEDEWDDAKSAFPGMEDLDNRLVAIYARKAGERKNPEGKLYPFIETVTVVLDNGLDGNAFTETVPAVEGEPIRLDDFQHSTTGLVARLRHRVEGKSAAGTALRIRPMLGRINSQPSQRNKKVLAYSIAEPTDRDKEIAGSFREYLRTVSAELKAKDAKAEDVEAFD